MSRKVILSFTAFVMVALFMKGVIFHDLNVLYDLPAIFAIYIVLYVVFFRKMIQQSEKGCLEI